MANRQTHERMLNITNHQGNANQNHNEISPHMCQNGYYQKTQITSLGEDVEKRESSVHCWWECKLVQPLWKTVWRLPPKLKIELPYNPAIPLLGIYPKKMTILI